MDALISHTSKVMLKILQARLQQYMNCEIPDIQGGFRKGRGISGESNGKELKCSNYCIIALISHASEVMFKIL